jgi:hypothetical protein
MIPRNPDREAYPIQILNLSALTYDPIDGRDRAARWSDHVRHRQGSCTIGRRRVIVTKFIKTPRTQRPLYPFEHRHNSPYRYSKIKGKTPLKALADMETKLIFPSKSDAPRRPLDKPEEGCYHLVRFIRSDCRLNIFGEMFPAPPETQYEYVVATVDVKEQKLKLFLDTIQVEEYKYQMRD